MLWLINIGVHTKTTSTLPLQTGLHTYIAQIQRTSNPYTLRLELSIHPWGGGETGTSTQTFTVSCSCSPVHHDTGEGNGSSVSSNSMDSGASFSRALVALACERVYVGSGSTT